MWAAKNDKVEVCLIPVSADCHSPRAIAGENVQVWETVVCRFPRQNPKTEGG